MKKDFKNILLLVIFVFILGASINVYAADLECYGVFDEDVLLALRNYIYVPIKIATPTLLLLLTSFDFAKVVFSGKKEDMDKVKKNFVKRLIAALVIFFAPNVVVLIADLVSGGNVKACLPIFE